MDGVSKISDIITRGAGTTKASAGSKLGVALQPSRDDTSGDLRLQERLHNVQKQVELGWSLLRRR